MKRHTTRKRNRKVKNDIRRRVYKNERMILAKIFAEAVLVKDASEEAVAAFVELVEPHMVFINGTICFRPESFYNSDKFNGDFEKLYNTKVETVNYDSV